eukprot:m.7280 g.7280  ORF g.7280 m.7280 type:complete len:418 (+) comp2178_c0_seq2:285-1538(+)
MSSSAATVECGCVDETNCACMSATESTNTRSLSLFGCRRSHASQRGMLRLHQPRMADVHRLNVRKLYVSICVGASSPRDVSPRSSCATSRASSSASDCRNSWSLQRLVSSSSPTAVSPTPWRYRHAGMRPPGYSPSLAITLLACARFASRRWRSGPEYVATNRSSAPMLDSDASFASRAAVVARPLATRKSRKLSRRSVARWSANPRSPSPAGAPRIPVMSSACVLCVELETLSVRTRVASSASSESTETQRTWRLRHGVCCRSDSSDSGSTKTRSTKTPSGRLMCRAAWADRASRPCQLRLSGACRGRRLAGRRVVRAEAEIFCRIIDEIWLIKNATDDPGLKQHATKVASLSFGVSLRVLHELDEVAARKAVRVDLQAHLAVADVLLFAPEHLVPQAGPEAMAAAVVFLNVIRRV